MASLPETVLGTASPAQDAILAHLSRQDKLSLAASCTALYGSSLAWFQEVDVEVTPTVTDVAAVAAWLHKYGAFARVTLKMPLDNPAIQQYISQEQVCACLSALPASLVASLAGGDITGHALPSRLPTSALARLTRLTSLELPLHFKFVASGDAANLWQLTALQRLRLESSLCTGAWRGLAALSQLQHLEINCGAVPPFKDLPAGLSTLTALTHLDLSTLKLPPQEHAILPQHLQRLSLLQHLSLYRVATSDDVMLQHLELSFCDLAAVPEQLSALTALTRLNLSDNDTMVGGWQHLRPLTRLRELDLLGVPLPDGVPPEVAALPALERCY
ncbi:hypothetical protein CHLNCDRAFT_141839 [Chlorella variabilis]|uniref:Uncharacterized protein n=1 Tax=Chlorella variabilis TaxID=554065 RepID=E1ZTP6_CHLVA|nr:hypothetical protein CHLNCDRAFT_141839 [Chlorella variabilis]EFN50796.1 hypothetical protein CHLNCDRAFT_141839 [Chlorella variabilis]|eukprot:XP_005842898.1 hypothetical protein CHLNCDRAFT_141839 [Chlorella variabilis]